jgi:hypothetical protein
LLSSPFSSLFYCCFVVALLFCCCVVVLLLCCCFVVALLFCCCIVVSHCVIVALSLLRHHHCALLCIIVVVVLLLLRHCCVHKQQGGQGLKGGGGHTVSHLPLACSQPRRGALPANGRGGYVPPAPLPYAQKGRATGMAQHRCKQRGLPVNRRGPHRLSCTGMHACGVGTVKGGASCHRKGDRPSSALWHAHKREWAIGVAKLKWKAVAMGCR